MISDDNPQILENIWEKKRSSSFQLCNTKIPKKNICSQFFVEILWPPIGWSVMQFSHSSCHPLKARFTKKMFGTTLERKLQLWRLGFGAQNFEGNANLMGNKKLQLRFNGLRQNLRMKTHKKKSMNKKCWQMSPLLGEFSESSIFKPYLVYFTNRNLRTCI